LAPLRRPWGQWRGRGWGDVESVRPGLRSGPAGGSAPGPACDGDAATVVPLTASVSGAVKPPYPAAAPTPTQLGPQGLRYDFNFGARVLLPNRSAGKWRVKLRDLDTGNILFLSDNQGALVSSAKHYYVRFAIDVSLVEDGEESPVFSHVLDLRGRDVVILFPVGTLGDTLGWFVYAARFAAVHGCRLTCAMSGLIIPLLRETYPDIVFVTHEELEAQKLQELAYASYRLGLFFDDREHVDQPTDFRMVGLHRTAAYILGVDPAEERPRLALGETARPIAEPYVCIAVQSSSQAKCWNNPRGWHEVVAFLRDAGYRVVCIDQKQTHGSGLVWNHIPHGVEDMTGDLPLVERARLLAHAEFFVGLSSGLSWLAWAAGAKVVMISGFTHPTNEFHTPYRIVNWHACNSCWNDPAERFDHHDFLWCPRHANTARQFECTRLITSEQVIATIERARAAAPIG
jgi:autotransporter strand-loop-strand O-heptosyltransferase